MGIKQCDMADLEKAFDDFIDRREYDRAEGALFSIVRTAFNAGWLAAGGEPPKPQKVLELCRKPLAKTPFED